MMRRLTWVMRAGVAVVVMGAAWLAWQMLALPSLPTGVVGANGRIEATTIDIATKIPGRIQDIFVNEGDFVTAGQVLARMNTDVLAAQHREAEALLKRATIGVDAARAQVTQRQAERQATLAVVAQRQAELDAAAKRLARSEELVRRGAASGMNREGAPDLRNPRGRNSAGARHSQ